MQTLPIAILLLLATANSAAGPAPTKSAAKVTSPEQLTALLERRWTVERIRRFCIPARRAWNGCQNLVPGFHKQPCKGAAVWHGELFKGKTTGFDRITWYGDACDGVAETYSLDVKRSKDFWVLEIGSPELLGTPPLVEPPTNQLCFEGGDHSMFGGHSRGASRPHKKHK